MAGAGSSGFNPLYGDAGLFEMFMGAVDEVIADAEIRGALEEFRLTPQALRGSLITAAPQILGTAADELAAYREARGGTSSHFDSGVVRAPVLGFLQIFSLTMGQVSKDTVRVQRWIGGGASAIGLLSLSTGLATSSAWPGAELLVWSGAMLLCGAGLVYSTLWLSGERGQRLFLGAEGTAVTGQAADEARNRLMAALPHEELLAQARTLINVAREDQFSHDYAVSSIAGLSEIYDATYQVPTETAAELDGLLGRLNGASIGVAGPRGSGKSTLIRGYCEATPNLQPRGTASGAPFLGRAESGELRCMVSAPVDYAARDFVLHLFATFCRAVIARQSAGRSSRPLSAAMIQSLINRTDTWWRNSGIQSDIVGFFIASFLIFALLHWADPIGLTLGVGGQGIFAVGILMAVYFDYRLLLAGRSGRTKPRRTQVTTRRSDRVLATAARRHLVRVRYLQTRTSGWSGTLGINAGSGGFALSSSRAEQPLSYPEIVAEFRSFAGVVANQVHRNGGRVFVGIDELDKIGTPEQAERFLNEIKGIFGIPHVFFMVSVSDDALTAFERRGLPLRDAFDSSFDEIIHVDPLSYAESRRLLYRRIIGLTEPYVALCHCLAGGLARDLIRAARQVTRAAQALSSTTPAPRDQGEDVAALSYQLLRRSRTRQTPVLGNICAAVVSDELRRKIRAVAQLSTTATASQAHGLHSDLSAAARRLTPGQSAITIVDALSRPVPGEPPAVLSLRADLGSYAYFCATLQDVFTVQLDASQITRATASEGRGSFDALAAARQAFALDPHLAWRSITEFRQAWGLETRDPLRLEQD